VSQLEPPFGDCVVLSVPLRRPPSFARLTRSEIEVAEGLLTGMTAQELARSRDVTTRTVGKQIESVYRKLGVSSRYELVALVSEAARATDSS
jgi:DNA-binding NarL/FixJ family response regulator